MLRILIGILLLISSPAWAITNWNKSLPQNGDNITSWPTVVTAQWSILDTLLSNYDRGENLLYKNATTLTVAAGEITVSNSGSSLRLFLQDTGNTDITSANLDTGASFSPSTTYYVYSATSSTTASSSTYYISLISSAPTGPTYYSKLGNFTTDGSGNIANVKTSDMIGFGTVTTQSISTIYQATTDGFVYVSGNSGSGGNSIDLFSDGSASPSTRVGRITSGTVNFPVQATICFPIKAGQYYQLTQGSGTSLSIYQFTPLQVN